MQTLWTRKRNEPRACPRWCQHYERERAARFGEIAAGVVFTWNLADPEGGIFYLLPTSKQTDDEIDAAKAALRRYHDVVGLHVRRPEPPCVDCGRSA